MKLDITTIERMHLEHALKAHIRSREELREIVFTVAGKRIFEEEIAELTALENKLSATR